MNAQPGRRRSTLLLAVGAAVGIGMAAYGLAGRGAAAGAAVPAGVAARVNEAVISADTYRRTLQAVAGDRRNPMNAAARRNVLDRLIDEELLVQRGLQLGFAEQDRKIRADITNAVIATVVAEYQDLQPDDAELEKFYETNRDFFTRPGNLRVRQIFVHAGRKDDEAAVRRATEAARRVSAGEDFAAVRALLGDRVVSPIPDMLLPPAKLEQYLGPTVLHRLLALPAGATSEAIRSGTGYHVVQVLKRQAPVLPPFAAIKGQVRVEFRRRKSEVALRSYLDDLRRRADVVVARTLP